MKVSLTECLVQEEKRYEFFPMSVLFHFQWAWKYEVKILDTWMQFWKCGLFNFLLKFKQNFSVKTLNHKVCDLNLFFAKCSQLTGDNFACISSINAMEIIWIECILGMQCMLKFYTLKVLYWLLKKIYTGEKELIGWV
jgi:hypothetical protein